MDLDRKDFKIAHNVVIAGLAIVGIALVVGYVACEQVRNSPPGRNCFQ